MNMTPYQQAFKLLNEMTEDQLIELFHDMSIQAVERIADIAYRYIENWADDTIRNQESISDWEEWKDVDDSQRLKDVKSS